GTIDSIKELDPMSPVPVYPESEIRYAVEVNRGWFAENDVNVGDALLEEAEEINEVKDKKGKGSGTKDACYYKVKSRYSVWPSAYASGALVKCRKVGAANWGNKSEGYIPEEKGGKPTTTQIGKHIPVGAPYRGVGATEKSNPFPGGKQKAYVLGTNRMVLVRKGEKPPTPSPQKQAENKKKERESLRKAYDKL
ncbi:MAG: hypothetical protein VXY93_19670, partial [Pseudomonadota bacterium]|nr:hypothetical protein [Pseudomonadota bacterium]